MKDRSAQRHCDGCGRPMAKAWVIADGLRYCGACYRHRFQPVPCEGCGTLTRSLGGRIPARCKRCNTQGRQCLRCGRPVPVAALVMPDGVACPSCVRYFTPPKPCAVCGRMSRWVSKDVKAGFMEPTCEKCRRRGHRVCSGCHKHRPPAGVDPEGRVLCRTCLSRGDEPFLCPQCGNPGRPHSARRCEECYWKDSVDKKLQDSLPQLSRPWVRDAFQGFVGKLKARIGAHKAAVKLPYYLRYFVALDTAFDAPGHITAERLIAVFGRDGLSHYTIPHGYLQQTGLIPADDDAAILMAAERMRWEKILARADGQWYAALLRRFSQYQEATSRRYRDRGWRGAHARFGPRTITNTLQAAAQFLHFLTSQDAAAAQQIQQMHVDRFLVEHAGLRNNLRAFVRYLNRKERLFRPIQIVQVTENLRPHNILPRDRYTALLTAWLNPHDSAVKEALICLLMLLYAQSLTRIVRLRLSDITRGQDGIYRVAFSKTEIALDPRVGTIMERYLATRRAFTAMEEAWENDWLFPGRRAGSHLDETTVAAYHLKKYEVTAQMLFSSALYYAYLSGLRHPKVLVKAFGITDQTAIKYMKMIDPRLRDEVEAHFAGA